MEISIERKPFKLIKRREIREDVRLNISKESLKPNSRSRDRVRLKESHPFKEFSKKWKEKEQYEEFMVEKVRMKRPMEKWKFLDDKKKEKREEKVIELTES